MHISVCVHTHIRIQVWGVCVYIHTCVHMHLTADAHWGQRHWILLELELQVPVSFPTWVLGIVCGHSAKAICTLIPESSLQLHKMEIIFFNVWKVLLGSFIRGFPWFSQNPFMPFCSARMPTALSLPLYRDQRPRLGSGSAMAGCSDGLDGSYL